MKCTNKVKPRKGCKDMWNAFMVKDASFDVGSDMPICISTDIIPASYITYEDALAIYRKEIQKKNTDFYINSFIVFYIDDQKFDGKVTKPSESDIIASRVKGLDLREHPTKYKQLSPKKMTALRKKKTTRTMTQLEYKTYESNKRLSARRDKGVKEFWNQEKSES